MGFDSCIRYSKKSTNRLNNNFLLTMCHSFDVYNDNCNQQIMLIHIRNNTSNTIFYNDVCTYPYLFHQKTRRPLKGQKLHPEFFINLSFLLRIKCRKVVVRVIVLQNNVPFDLFKLQLKLYSAVFLVLSYIEI